MARVTMEMVQEAMEFLRSNGEPTSVPRIRERIGSGSFATIQKFKKQIDGDDKGDGVNLHNETLLVFKRLQNDMCLSVNLHNETLLIIKQLQNDINELRHENGELRNLLESLLKPNLPPPVDEWPLESYDEIPIDYYQDHQSSPPANYETPLLPPKPTVLDALKHLAWGDDDRAAEKNHRGYNKVDTEFGHDLASKQSLSYKQAQAGYKMIRKYTGQLKEVGIDYEAIEPQNNGIEAGLDWSNGNPFLSSDISPLNKDDGSQEQNVSLHNGLDESTEFRKAIKLLDNGENVFITGKAGTGKTTLIKHWLKQTDKEVAIVAPTGIAAMNAGGVTIHSFLGLPPRLVTPDEIQYWKSSKRREAVKRIDTLIVDEASMLLAPMLDNMAVALQKNRSNREIFGGVQMVFVGDLFQLPPIVSNQKGRGKDQVSESEIMSFWGYETEFFFSAHIFKEMRLNTIELQKVYRQKDDQYLQVLNHVRTGQVTSQDFEILNSRVNPSFTPGNDFYMTLEPTNRLVDATNFDSLKKLKGKKHTYKAKIEGQFNEKNCPAEPDLELKEGAQIMFVANHKDGLYVNGSMGKIIGLDDEIEVELENGNTHMLERFKWENNIYVWDAKTRKLSFETVGTLTQYPIKLAYAVTVHKSQGLQFDRLVIGNGNFFANGQLYVALSRCTNLNGLILKRPLAPKDVMVDNRVLNFMTNVNQY